ncbi:MAG: ATP-binding cassette domain-containing protein [Rhizobiales bacterium]|nr:ATP-binding cassette domain-containing protein [Hyphomicrobiales bacterium]
MKRNDPSLTDYTPSGKPSPTDARASHRSVMAELLPYVWPEGRPDLRWRVALAGVALLVAKIITVAVPLAYKAAVDWLTAHGPLGQDPAGTLALVAIMMIVAYGVGRIAMVGFTQIRDVLFTRVGQHAVRSLANRTFAHLHRLSLRFHMERRTGGLSRVIERAIKAIELLIRMGAMNTIPTIIEAALIAAMLAWYFGVEYVVVISVTVALYLWFTVKASEWRITIRREMNDSDTDANSKAIDSLLNYETVKYFGNEGLEARRFDASMARYEDASIRTYYSLGWLNFGQAFIFSIGMTICMWMAADGVVAGTQTVGDFVMINALLIQLYIPLNFMGMIYREIKQGLVDLETMFALLDEHPEVQDAPDARQLAVSGGEVRFEDVTFAYDPERVILKGVSFTVPVGKMVAIVGPSGAGKSTISRILFRFYDISSGRVTIDGQDITKVTQTSLRAAIGVVPQDTVLFNDTIYYNIRYGRPDASREEIVEAARMAQIASFIEQLPEGFDTKVGERGLKLSGGEKQRVAIARTILKAPPILMLDEATSALDSHTEKEIQDALDRVARDRTTLVIAHRLSTIVHADNIIVLEKGRIVEQGTHGELMEKKGLYASMWNRQREAEEARAKLAAAIEAGAIR